MAVDINSPLIRKQWVVEGMIGKAHQSFWTPYTGDTDSAIIYQNKDLSCGLNQVITFDFDGKLTGEGMQGWGEVCGIGETDRKFSSQLKMDVFSWMTTGQLKTDACDINDLELYYHKGARSRLMDLYLRHKDQFIFDTFVGALGCPPTHIYDLGCSFEFSDIMEISNAAKEGIGFKKPNPNGTVSDQDAEDRMPLEGFKLSNGNPVYLMVITSKMAMSLKQNPAYQTIMVHGDVRGNNNAVISGIIGQHENIIFVTAPTFSGSTKGKGKFKPVVDSKITFSGLRRFAVGADGVVVWQGQRDFRKIEKLADQEKLAKAQAEADLERLNEAIKTATGAKKTALQAEIDNAQATIDAPRQNKVYSRGLLLGQSAGQFAYGQPADYQVEPTRFKRRYDSLLDVFMNFQKTQLELEMGEDYEGATVTELDYGVIAVDMEE